MYQLDEQKVKGMIKVRKGEKIKAIQRRGIIQILKEEMDKESVCPPAVNCGLRPLPTRKPGKRKNT